MSKAKVQQFRITETLKARYDAALQGAGLTSTDHLTAEVVRFVEAYEKKAKQKAAANK